MQHLAQEKTADNGVRKLAFGLWAPIALAGISIGIALTAIFLLSDWAETAPLHHAVQHVLIFAAGAGFSSSFFYLSKKGARHEG